jgi:hypothetical protein
VALWGYRSLRFEGEGEGEGEEEDPTASGSLDTAGLERAPTIVRPHWRRVKRDEDGQPVVRLVGSYSAHRWRRADRLGEKVGV